MQDVSSDYAVLEVRPDSSWEEIQRAYMDLAIVWRPDRFAPDRRLQDRAQQKLLQIETAYRRLEAQRANSSVRAGSPSGSTPENPPASGFREPFWKTVPPWVVSVVLPALAGVCAIVGWLGVLHYLSLPSRGPLANRSAGSLNAAPAALFSEKTIEVTAVPDPAAEQRLGASGLPTRSRVARQSPVRPENGEALIEPIGPSGNGTIQIRNHHPADIVADIWQWNGERRMVRSVFVRSGEDAVVPGVGLGLYQAMFHTALSREERRLQPEQSFRLADSMRFYEVKMAGETQSVCYVLTVP